MRGIPATISGKLAMAALVGLAIVEGLGVYVVEGEVPPIAIVFIVVLLLLALLMMAGRWWINVLVGVISGLLCLVTITGGMSTLTNPGDPGFISAVTFLALSLVAAVAGIWSAVQARQTE